MNQTQKIIKSVFRKTRAIVAFTIIGALFLTFNVSATKAAEISIFDSIATYFGWQTTAMSQNGDIKNASIESEIGLIAPNAVLLSWNTFGNAGTETTEPSTANDPNLQAANLTQGTITAAGNANRFGGSGWFNTGNTAGGNTLAEAVAGNDYIQFVVTPNSGFSFTPTSLVFIWDRSGTGPSNVTLRSSADGFTANLGTVTGITGGSFATNTINISGLTNITTPTTFRLYGYGATATGGTGGFDASSSTNNVVLNGTTASTSANPTVAVTVSSNSGSEAAQTEITVTATASNVVSGDQTVSLGVSGTGITAGDYSLSNTMITVPNGMTTGSVTFTIVDDIEVEGTETATLTISNPSSGITLGSPTTQNITITDNDNPPLPTVSLAIDPTSGSEAAQTTFTATATATAPVSGDQTVSFSLSGGNATTDDFTAIPATIIIPNGMTSGTGTFSIVDDTLVESTETGIFAISNPSSGITLGATTTASVTITDNDVAPASDLTISQSAPATVAVGGTLTYTLVVTNTGAAVTTPFSAQFILPSPISDSTIDNAGCFNGTNSINAGVVSLNGCTLSADSSSTITVSVTPTTTGTLMSGSADVDSFNVVTETNETNNGATGVSTTVNGAPTGIVINEVYGGGGNSGAPLDADFIELYNTGSATVDLGGYSLQYASATGAFNSVIALPSTSIAPGGYYTVQTTSSVAPGFTPDFVSPNSVNMSAIGGNVLLAAGTTTVGTCPAPSASNVLDRVGYGTGDCSEATAAPNASNTTSVQRIPNGTDTNDNSSDFKAATPTPGAVNFVPSVTLSIDPSNGSEAAQTTFTATATASGAVPSSQTISFSLTGGTASAADFTTIPTTITIPSGMTTGTVTFSVFDDILVEGDEMGTFTISNPSSGIVLGTTTQVSVLITDNDFVIPSLSINDVSQTEGNSGTTTFSFAVNLSSPAGAGGVTFDIATADGTATAGSDYVARSLTGQTIPQGSSTYNFDVTVNGDTTFETDETFFVNVTNVTGATVSDGNGDGTIQNDDSEPTISVNDVSINEGNSGTTDFTFTISLSNPSSQIVTVNYATADGTANAGSDYVSTSGLATITPGNTSTNFTVAVNGDVLFEPNETFFVNLTSPANATINDEQGQGTIQNDDSEPTVNVSVNPTTVSETGQPQVTITATASSAVNGNQTVDLALDGTSTATAGDFTGSIPATITISDGMINGSVTVNIFDDSIFEGTEIANFTISNPSSGITLGMTQTASLTINDNDSSDNTPPIVSYTPIPNQTTPPTNLILPVTVSDDTNISSVTIFYQIQRDLLGSGYASNSCNSTSPLGGVTDNYECVIPGTIPSNSAVSYYVVASDGASNMTSNPSQGASAPNLFTVGAATISGGTYANLNPGNGSTLGGNANVINVLTLDGIFNVGNSTLTIECFGSISGAGTSNYVVGSVRKEFCGATSFVYPVGTVGGENPGYSPVFVSPSITPQSEGESFLTISAEDTVLPGLSSTDFVSRNWDLNGLGLTVNITFNYLPGDANGNSANYKVVRRVGSSNQTVCASGCVSGNSATVTNVSSFSKWGIGDLAPTAAAVNVGGRIIRQNGQGISKARVIMTDSQGNIRMALTNPFGYYRFSNVSAGETYTFAASHKQFNLSNSQIRFISEEDFGIDFIADVESENLKSDKDVKNNLYPTDKK